MSESSSFDRLLDGLRADDPAAAERVVRETYRRVVGLVRGRIADRYRAKLDAESVANSAFAALFRTLKQPDADIEGWDDVWNLLACIAVRKLANRVRRFATDGRNAEREVPADAMALAAASDAPEAAVMVSELLDRLTAGFDPTERQVIDMSLAGYMVSEIAEAVDLSERTVIRVRDRFRTRTEGEMRREE